MRKYNETPLHPIRTSVVSDSDDNLLYDMKKLQIKCRCIKDFSMKYYNRRGCCPWCGLSQFEKYRGKTCPHKLDCPVFGVQ